MFCYKFLNIRKYFKVKNEEKKLVLLGDILNQELFTLVKFQTSLHRGAVA